MSIKIYTTAVCPFCIAAKRLLREHGLSWEEIRVDSQPQLRQELSDAHGGWKTVPMIFLNGEFLGGYAELKALVTSGQLEQRITA